MISIMNAIRAVRNRRAEMNVPPSRKCTLYVMTAKPDSFAAGEGYMCRLAYADRLVVSETLPEGHEDMAEALTADAKLFMPLAQLVDVEKELARIAKEKAKAENDLARTEGKLNNKSFTDRAPQTVVDGERAKAQRLRDLLSQLEGSEQRLKRLS